MLLETAPGVPNKVSNTVSEMEEKRKAPADQKKSSDERRHQRYELIVIICPGSRANQPRSEYDEPDRQRYTGGPVQDRKRHRYRPAIDRKMR